MLDMLVRHWWALALRGVAAILFGICANVWPGITQATLVWFSAPILVDGVFAHQWYLVDGERERCG